MHELGTKAALRSTGGADAQSPPPGGAEPAPAPTRVSDPEPRRRTFVRGLLREPGWSLAFAPAPRPEVSIIVVTLNRVEHTYDCLESLLAHADTPHELIVVDNGSTDETLDLLSRLRNATVIRNHANLGFARACNQAAARAAAPYLLFLNNDAALTPGCVSALVETARADLRCGAVGGRLVWPDGRLQEAGSVLWDDGAVEAYGRGSDPLAPEFSYLREVDLCSGTALLVRREVFTEIEGFDERYVPAYYEDVDLCLDIRRRGYSVLYQPEAWVRHHEFGSSSFAEAVRLMERNRARFTEKWGDELKGQRPRSTADVLRAQERAASSSRGRYRRDNVNLPRPDPRPGRAPALPLSVVEHVAALAGDGPRVLHVDCPGSLLRSGGCTVTALVAPGSKRSLALSLTWAGPSGTEIPAAVAPVVPPFAPVMEVRVPVRVPEEPGEYELLAGLGSADAPRPAPAWRKAVAVRPLYGASYEASVPSTLRPGRTTEVPVYLTNEGMLTWEVGSFRLSYHWRPRGGGPPLVWDGRRSDLPHVIAPGNGVSLRACVEAPPEPGSWILEWDLVIEGRAWLSELGVETAAYEVAVHHDAASPTHP